MKRVFLLVSICCVSIFKVQAQSDIKKSSFPSTIIEQAPVFPGCRGKEVLKRKCFNSEMQGHLDKHMNAEMMRKLKLKKRGKIQIIALFTIDMLGKVKVESIKAPHTMIKKEVERVLKLLPRMKPGRHKGLNAETKYTLPIMVDLN